MRIPARSGWTSASGPAAWRRSPVSWPAAVVTERALVVGHGYAGTRFVTALRHLAGVGFPVELAGVCDRTASRLPAGVPGFTELAEALRSLRPSLVCVTVNEADHLPVYEILGEFPRLLVISEKPLTTESRHLDRARKALSGHCF